MFYKDPEPANSEGSGRTFKSIVNRNLVSEANSSSGNVAKALSRDVFFESPIV